MTYPRDRLSEDQTGTGDYLPFSWSVNLEREGLWNITVRGGEAGGGRAGGPFIRGRMPSLCRDSFVTPRGGCFGVDVTRISKTETHFGRL